MSKIHSVWGFIRRHKYFVVIAFFAIMLGFADENSFWARRQRIQEIEALKAERREYQNKYDQDTRALEELETNPEAVVRTAREKYLMKYPDEDVYVFMDEVQKEETQEAKDEGTN
ncbi:MAG: septum formation initiator family protein [Bacteroidaceae bacterium]|nr:septum formation initiator family protein [Bacteroidaceae bacterium]